MDANRSAISEAATRQILLRIASVFNDADICDGVFVVGEGDEKEEVCAPSQFMAISSPAFKAMFYPPTGNRETPKLLPEIQPHIFRKILDYLFRGMVPLSTLEDAWKVKVASRQLLLTDLEDLCTKYLKYRLDVQNLIQYMKNASKYNAPDIREVVIQRFTKEANAVLNNEELLELSQDELLGLFATRPSMQASRLIRTLIKWAKKRYGYDECESAPAAESKGTAAAAAAAGDDAFDAAADSADDDITDRRESESAKSAAPPKVVDLVDHLRPFAEFLHWEKSDSEYFLKEVRGNHIMSTEAENSAMAEMLHSFVQNTPPVRVSLTRPVKSSKKLRGSPGPNPGGVDCMVVMEKLSETAGGGGYVKTDDDALQY